MESEALSKFKESIREQVISGDIKLALDQLHSYVGEDGELGSTIVLLTASHVDLVRNNAAGVLEQDDYVRGLAKIKKSILDLLPMLKDHTPPPSPEMSVAVAVPSNVSLEKIIGTSNLQQIGWLEDGLKRARSVCRILLANEGRGTGFLIGPGLLMTNHHVLPDKAAAQQAIAEFNYQQGGNREYLPTSRYSFDITHFLTSPTEEFDYTIVGLKEPDDGLMPPLASWGELPINADANPVPGEHVVIIQHPIGGLKQIALTANQVLELWDHRIFYSTDTMPGSSGSPIFNDLWQVVAIHHAGGPLKPNPNGEKRFTNEGILMSAIRLNAGEAWPL